MQLARVAERYDPNPTGYQAMPHRHQYEGRTWQVQEAATMHQLGVKVGLLVWLNRKAYQLAADSHVSQTLRQTSKLFDTLYARCLRLPRQWTPRTWRWFGTYLAGIDPQMAELVAPVLRELAGMGVLTDQQRRLFIAAFNGEPTRFEPKRVLSFEAGKQRFRQLSE